MDTVGLCMDRKIEIKWMSLPQHQMQILEVLNCSCKTACNSNRCGCFKNEQQCTEICRCENCSNCDQGEDDTKAVDIHNAPIDDDDDGEDGDDDDSDSDDTAEN